MGGEVCSAETSTCAGICTLYKNHWQSGWVFAKGPDKDCAKWWTESWGAHKDCEFCKKPFALAECAQICCEDCGIQVSPASDAAALPDQDSDIAVPEEVTDQLTDLGNELLD
jgi:hypothetical protein